jgi:myo-inositol catabolism protein IolC
VTFRGFSTGRDIYADSSIACIVKKIVDECFVGTESAARRRNAKGQDKTGKNVSLMVQGGAKNWIRPIFLFI